MCVFHKAVWDNEDVQDFFKPDVSLKIFFYSATSHAQNCFIIYNISVQSRQLDKFRRFNNTLNTKRTQKKLF